MFSLISYLVFGSVLLAGAATYPGTVCRARLELQQKGGMLNVTGRCQNLTGTTLQLRYEMSVEKSGQSGESRNSQSGRFEAAPGQEITLSRSAFNLLPGDHYELRLRVLDQAGNTLAADSVTAP